MSYTLRVAYGMHGTDKDTRFLAPHLAWADVFAPEITYVDENLEDMWNDVSLGRSADFLSCVSHPFFATLVSMTARTRKIIWLCDYFDDQSVSAEYRNFLNRFASLGTIITKRYDIVDCATRVRAMCARYADWQNGRERSFVDQLVERLDRLPSYHHTSVLVFFGLGHRSSLSEKLLLQGIEHEVVTNTAKAKHFLNRGKNKYAGQLVSLEEYAHKLDSNAELIRMVLLASTYHLGYNSRTSFRLRRRIALMGESDVLRAYDAIRKQQIANGFQNYFRL